ncbi:protein crumbs homolog 1-like [Mercenaria mercenaria]|uniref:protein crumbs homolog 1-like n=1 Tax=Mercenaria mercenaria TaxID=6596 RepID=UPI00234E458D|nr:protein crumbs homolog 1-like [Mercenaria mercenaria]XP_053381260.1 protein crumbs homolog 1-like [Mercenaria mercenaria]
MMYVGRTCLLYFTIISLELSCMYAAEGSCEVDPCQNFATCIHDNNTFTCVCPPQYTGQFCEVLKDACDPNPCNNGGTCVEEADGFQCLCTEHALGPRCEAVRRYCLNDNPCKNNAVCEDIHNGGYECYCSPGYYGNYCEKEIDECRSSPCMDTATCQDEVNGYICRCPLGKSGIHCEVDVTDGCVSEPCMNGGTCVDIGDNGQYSCTCVPGFEGVNCQTNIDDCAMIQCGPNQICKDLVSGYRCECTAGRTGESCEVVTDACVSNPCQNSGTCMHDTDRYLCNCPQGYAGINCEIQIDLCYPNPCHHQATCVTNHSLVTGYVCNCSEYFLGERCEGKVTSCQSLPCQHGGSCIENINTPGYTCQCTSGYTGSQCETSVDSCLFTGCNNGGTCTSSATGHECTCLPGWTGKECNTDIDECNISPCYNGGVCINIQGSYICMCGNYWTGMNCEHDVTECSTMSCLNNGTCVEVDGGQSYCQCSEGTTGVYCETVLDGCEADLCHNGALCVYYEGNYTCQCQPGFQGTFCEENINDCEPDPCINGGTCQDGNNDYTCHCTEGYIGKNCSEDIEECRSSPCLNAGTCSEPTVGVYHCDCIPGVYGNHCEIVTIATFNGSSSVKLAPLSSFLINTTESISEEDKQSELSALTEVTISFWFSTSVYHGTILSVADVTECVHFLVQLDSDILKVSVDMYGETVTGSIKLLPHSISRHVLVSITTSYMNISLNQCHEGEVCELTVKYEKDGARIILSGPLVIGGVDDVTPYLRSKLLTLSPFIGCIGNVTVSGELVNFANTQSEQLSLVAGCRSHDLCHDDVCQNGGTCRDLWSTSYCECPQGYIGSLCEFQQTAQFQAVSFLHFTKDFTEVTSLSLWLTSNSASGVILYTLDQDMLCLYIDDGQLVVHLVVNGDDFTSNIGSLQNGEWYHLTIQFHNGFYTLTLSNGQRIVESITGQVGYSLNVHTPLFMGQFHDHPALDMWRNKLRFNQFTSFSGCVKNLTINDKLVDFQTASPSVFGNDPVSAMPGCTRDLACSLSPCRHSGTCIPSWNNYTCQCTSSYTGDHCELAEAVTFNGDSSYIDMKLNTSLTPFGDTGFFEFRTRDETATLMYIQFFSEHVNTSLEFGLYKSCVYVSLSADNISRLSCNDSVSDGEWHALTWVRNREKITVNLDSTSLSTSLYFDPFIFEPIIRMFVGGKPYNFDNPGFMIGLTKGCVRNVSFNGNNLNILEDFDAELGVDVIKKDILPTCVGDNMCREGACPENSDCEDIWNDKVCTCHDGWHGNICNVSIDDCVSNLCSNGECVDDHRNYTCLCNNGYTGMLCDVLYNPCDSQPCFQNGTANCTLKFPSEFECLCNPGWSGLLCSEDINECESNPCVNNGICTDLENDFECVCKTDSFGKRCENIRICSSAPCFNGGTCAPNENNTDFSCNCLLGYLGKQCQIHDFCQRNMCQNNGSCVSSSSGYTCSCLQENYGVYCQFNDYCASEPCLNDGICHNDVTSFRCTCTNLFSGDTCETPVNRCENNVCRNGGSCFFNASDLTSDYICSCVEGFTGVHCETDIDECQSNPCQNGAVCVESNQQPWKFFPGFHCSCVQGYSGPYCQYDVNECESMPCANNGTCKDLVNRFECECMEGFTGKLCELDKRGCSSAPCHNNGVCEPYEDSYTCVCTAGYTGPYCQIDIDNCVHNTCMNDAVCIDGVNSYTCQCQPGYSGKLCEHVHDACFSQPCMNNGRCIFRGLCNCSDIVQTCGWYNESCQVDTCSDTPECSSYTTAYLCDCAGSGYEGETCDTDVNECLHDVSCEHGGICTNTAGSYTCDCKHTGYIGSRCEEDIDECSGPNPCYNGGQCKNLFGSFKCLCGAGWTGDTCGELIDSCHINPCDNGGTCINTRSGYICDCANSGFQGDNCDINVNDCVGNPCLNNGRCIDGVNLFTCDCMGTGYHGNFCEIETDHCASLPCKNNGSCTDTGLSYQCECTTGYTGVNCSEDINECNTEQHRCTADSICLNNVGSYTCACLEGFTGEFCKVSMQENIESSSNTGGVVAASVIIIIIIIIVLLIYAVWYIRKLRRMKGRYKPSQIEAANPPAVSVIPLEKIIDPTTGERLI